MHLGVLFGVLTATLASSLPILSTSAELPPYFILTGDSTTATGGGWGDGFLAYRQNGAGGLNVAKNGATTVSFRAEGHWTKAIQAVKDSKSSYRPVVTIQFGHNDQKPEKGISLAQFQSNMETLAGEVIGAGGTPIVVTSLTRRKFKNGVVNEDLVEHTAAAIAAANAVGIEYLDLNAASTAYVSAIGEEYADQYNMEEGDKTHLNAAGKIVFGRMLGDLLVRARPDLATYVRENKALSDKIWAGQFATGSE